MPIAYYDGIALPFTVTEAADENQKYSEDGIDLLYTERVYQFSSVFTPQAIHTAAVVAAAPRNPTAADILNVYRCRLAEPRKALRIDFDGGVIVNIPEGQDAKGGPFPEVLSLTRFAGSDTLHIKFKIRCYTIDCCAESGVRELSNNPERIPDANGGGSAVQWRSNRWTEGVEISGEDFRSVITRTGKLVIRPGELVCDAFRGLVTPAVPPNFLRQRASYQIATDGLSMAYTFVDEEQWCMPPPGAIRASGTCRISADRGIWRYVDVTVSLVGDVKQSKFNLLQLAVTVCMHKLEKCGVAKNKAGQWLSTQGAIVEQMYSNKIEVSVRALLQPAKKNQTVDTELRSRQAQNALIGAAVGALAFNPALGAIIGWNATSPPVPAVPPKPDAKPIPKGLDLDFKGIGGKPWGSDGFGVQPDMGLRSTGAITLVAAAFRDPCLTETIRELRSVPEAMNPTLQGKPGVEPGMTVEKQQNPPGFVGPPAPKTEPFVGPLPQGVAPRPNDYFFNPPKKGSTKSNAVRAAEVSIVDTPDEPTQFISTGSQADTGISALYTNYEIFLKVEEDEQSYVCTEQRAGGLTHVIPTSAPTKKLIAEWTCERVGEPPAIPDSNLGDPNCVLLRKSYSPGTVELDEAGVLICGSAGRYEYQFLDPALADKLGAGLPPWAAELLGGASRPVIYGGPKMIEDGTAVSTPTFIENLENWKGGSEAGGGGQPENTQPPAEDPGGGTVFELVTPVV